MIERSVFSIRVVDGGASLDTVTSTVGEVAVFPDSSRATAVNVCDPSGTLVVFHVAANGTAVSVARSDPSTNSCTPTTATLSAASTVTGTKPLTSAPLACDVMATVGAVGSDGAPATSNASMKTRKSAEAAFFVRVTSTASVCGPDGRPLVVNSTACTAGVGAYASTVAVSVPST